MDARLLSRLTSSAAIVIVGMGSAHLLMPVRPGATPFARVAFVAALAVVGAAAGWRERRERRERRLDAETRSAIPLELVGIGIAFCLAFAGWLAVHA